MLRSMKQRTPLSVRLMKYLLRLAIQLPVFLALYVLSIGPLFWQWYESYYLDGSPFFKILYLPLLLACNNETVRYYVNRYIDWWIL